MKRPPALLLIFAVIAATVLPWVASPPGSSAAVLSVDAWIGVSSTRPSLGCAIDMSVELRDSGHAVDGAQIEVALHIEGSLVSADRGVTGDSGVAFLALQTFDSAAGVRHWVDVNVSGEYFTGFPVVTADRGSCNDAYQLIEASGDVTITPSSTSSSPASLIDGA